MLLAIDIGNTNIVLGGISSNEIVFTARLSTDRNLTKDQYTIQIKSILSVYNINTVEDCIISSVVPHVLISISEAIFLIIGKKPMIIQPGIKTGLNILMHNPAQVGSDLIVNAVAGINQYTVPLVIIDMGTATTISIIDKNKNYVGGYIMPGVKISLEALSDNAAQLPYISLDEPKKSFGKNTIDCMKSGIILGNAYMLDGMIQHIEEELEQKVTAVATGGIVNIIIPYCKSYIIYDDNLLLKGLLYIYNKNK